MATTVLVRGLNDVASAVALRLHQAGFRAVLQDDEVAPVSRRGMSFADAAEGGTATLESVTARMTSLEELPAVLGGEEIPVLVAPLSEVLDAIVPDMLVDARMRKRAVPEDERAFAPTTIGLGPNFVAGGNVHVAIETSWDDLGRIIYEGPTLPLDGDPRPIDGHSRDRFVYSSTVGLFKTTRHIGDQVSPGDLVGEINGEPIFAPIRGILRGLVQDGISVVLRTKLLEVDPRRGDAVTTGVGQRPDAIAAAVTTVVQAHE